MKRLFFALVFVAALVFAIPATAFASNSTTYTASDGSTYTITAGTPTGTMILNAERYYPGVIGVKYVEGNQDKPSVTVDDDGNYIFSATIEVTLSAGAGGPDSISMVPCSATFNTGSVSSATGSGVGDKPAELKVTANQFNYYALECVLTCTRTTPLSYHDVSYSVAGDNVYGTPDSTALSGCSVANYGSVSLAAHPTTSWTTADGTADGRAGTWSFAPATGWSTASGSYDSGVTALKKVTEDATVYGKWVFTPAPIPLLDSDVTLVEGVFTYDGTEKRPEVIVEHDGVKLACGADYELSYESNVAAGIASVTVTGVGDYTASVIQEFTINPRSIASASAKLSATAFVYNGKARVPVVTVTMNGKVLTEGDYSVSYYNAATGAKVSSPKNVGSYKAVISGVCNYTGTLGKTFTIKPAPTAIKSLTKGKKSFKVTWTKKTAQVTGYQIKYSTKSSMASAKTVTVTSYKTTAKTVKNLKAKKKYYVQVRTYKTVGKTKYYSAWSTKKAVTTK